MSSLAEMGKASKLAAYKLAKLSTEEKNKILSDVAKNICDNADKILLANEKDIENAINNNMKPSLVDRLKLSKERIDDMAKGVLQVVSLDDPVFETLSTVTRDNGLVISQIRVPFGLIGIIYESRPNVTLDAFALCFKTSNAVILRGGSDAINSNMAIVEIIRQTLKTHNFDENAVSLITDTNREVVAKMLKLKDYIDVIIPRGGAGLIKMCVENSTVPVIETGTGNCHIFVDESADIDMALNIIFNAKTQRIGVCNACESLVIHNNIAKEFIPLLVEKLKIKNVEIRGDERAVKYSDYIVDATEEDFGCEYLDYIISVKVVDDIDEAISHINKYNTKHSEAIITKNDENATKFLNEIDAACVYVNASTRFTDGFEFGFGAEIGISTQKLHARGPMGLKELCSTKYVIKGNGQVRG